LNDMDKKQILIVDDKESIAKILSVYLGYEYEIVFYDNPIKALAWLQDGNMPDLIVSDIRMPEMRGDEFLMLLKQDELFRQIPVIMLSSEDSTSERIRLLESGADDYIVKPFNPMELKLRVKKLI
jgi:putative two-component system response regulator